MDQALSLAKINQGLTGENPSVDASGTFPNGQKFDGPQEFKKVLAKDEKRLANAFVQQLATYALRRVMTVDDRPHIAKIVENAKGENYRLRSMVEHLITSELFRNR